MSGRADERSVSVQSGHVEMCHATLNGGPTSLLAKTLLDDCWGLHRVISS